MSPFQTALYLRPVSKTLREKEKTWQDLVNFLVASRKETDNGLMPPDNYAGDIATQVYALNSNANCWRGLREVVRHVPEMLSAPTYR